MTCPGNASGPEEYGLFLSALSLGCRAGLKRPKPETLKASNLERLQKNSVLGTRRIVKLAGSHAAGKHMQDIGHYCWKTPASWP